MKIFVRAQGLADAGAAVFRARSRILFCLGAGSGISSIDVEIFPEQGDGSPDLWACRIVARCEDLVVVSQSTSGTAAAAVDACCGRMAHAITRPKRGNIEHTKPCALRRAS